ncbi:MAG: DUF3040 domain-containing protein [Micromonosporaceae bacterium]|nr:DUF3040 domain-containing protein [Micromonosporaceae bacterium]
MPLSEHEQRLFEQIERSLAEDPKFASAVRATDPRFHVRRRLILAGVFVVAGLVLVIFAVSINQVLLGVAGFLLMLGAAVFGLTSLRRGRGAELRAVDGTASRSTAARRRSSFIDRLEERWRQRPEDNR